MKFDLRNKLYIGGHPDVKSLTKINSNSGVNFKGCIQQLYFDDVRIIPYICVVELFNPLSAKN